MPVTLSSPKWESPAPEPRNCLLTAVCYVQGETEEAQRWDAPCFSRIQERTRAGFQEVQLPGQHHFPLLLVLAGRHPALCRQPSAPAIPAICFATSTSHFVAGALCLFDLGLGRRSPDEKIHNGSGSWHLSSSSGPCTVARSR